MSGEDELVRLFIRSAMVVIICGIGSFTVYNGTNDVVRRVTYAHSIDTAISSGRDPLLVGCAYGDGGSTANATLCAVNQAKRQP